MKRETMTEDEFLAGMVSLSDKCLMAGAKDDATLALLKDYIAEAGYGLVLKAQADRAAEEAARIISNERHRCAEIVRKKGQEQEESGVIEHALSLYHLADTIESE